jgi:hypothetical protein
MVNHHTLLLAVRALAGVISLAAVVGGLHPHPGSNFSLMRNNNKPDWFL